MQIILQKSKVYLIFYIFLSKILSIFAINIKHTGDSLIEPPALFLCTWYLVPWSLSLSCEGVNLVSAEDEDLAVTESSNSPKGHRMVPDIMEDCLVIK